MRVSSEMATLIMGNTRVEEGTSDHLRSYSRVRHKSLVCMSRATHTRLASYCKSLLSWLRMPLYQNPTKFSHYPTTLSPPTTFSPHSSTFSHTVWHRNTLSTCVAALNFHLLQLHSHLIQMHSHHIQLHSHLVQLHFLLVQLHFHLVQLILHTLYGSL